MNKDALRKYYESILPLLGLDIGSDDFISTFSLDTEGEKIAIPLMVNNLPVIFPTDAVLREGKWNDRVGFHPLSESITRGISPMMVSMTTALKFKIYQSIFYTGFNLIKVAKEIHEGSIKNTPVKLVEILGKLPKTVDAKSLSFFSKVMAAGNETDQAIVKVCIKRNGSILGTDYKRTASIYFPIYEQLVKAIEDKESEFWGITAARKSDLLLIKEVLEIILPDINDENRYAFGTFANTAPYLDCFVRAAAKVQDSINATMDLLDKYMPSNIRLALYASTDWLEEEQDTRGLRNVVPPLKYNEGDITEEELKTRESDTERVQPRRQEKSLDIPDFTAKGTNAVKRASEVKPSTGIFGGRRYIDNSLTEEERRNPARSERRMSSRDEDDYERGRDRDRDRGRERDRDSGRGRGRDDYRERDRDRGRSRGRDTGYDDDRDRDYDRGRDRDRGRGRESTSSGGSWLDRQRERDSRRDSRRR